MNYLLKFTQELPNNPPIIHIHEAHRLASVSTADDGVRTVVAGVHLLETPHTLVVSRDRADILVHAVLVHG